MASPLHNPLALLCLLALAAGNAGVSPAAAPGNAGILPAISAPAGAMVLCTHRTMLSTPAQAVALPVAGVGVGVGVGAMVLCTHRTMLSPLAINVVLPVAPTPLAAAMAKITKSPNPTLADWQKLVESKPKGIDFKSLCPIGPGNFVMSLCQDLQGRIYAGTEGDGLWSFDPFLPLADQWHHFTRANTGGPPEPNGATIESGNFLGDDYIYALTCDKLGRIWAGHLNHGVSVYNGQSGTGVPPVSGWKNYNILEGPLGERIFALATCPTDDSVWMATSAGLARYSLKKDTWSNGTAVASRSLINNYVPANSMRNRWRERVISG